MDAARETIPAADATFSTFEKDRKVVGQLLACAVAYRLFLWLLPLALLVACALGFVESSGAESASHVASSAGLGSFVVSTVDEAASEASRSRWILLLLSVVALYSASAGGAKTLRAVFATVWGVAPFRPRRRWAPPLCFAGVMLAVAVISFTANWARGHGVREELVVRALLFVALAGLALFASALLPHPPVPLLRLVPGALLLAVGAQALHVLTVFYLSPRLRSSSELYGGLGAAATILLWLYLIGRLVVLSAVLNATLWERQTHPPRNHPGG